MIKAAVNYSKKPGLFKEQIAGFSAQIQSVTLTKTCLKKRHVTLMKEGGWVSDLRSA